MSLIVGGANGFTDLFVVTRNDDGKNGCNLTGSTTLVVNVVNSNPGVATVSPSQLTFTNCEGVGSNLTTGITVTPVSVGSTNISLSLVSNNTEGTFNLAPATFTVNVSAPVPTDSTPPVITPSVVGTLGDNGWYTSDVTVSWSVVDNESTVTSTTGCGSTLINTDTTGTTLTCSATSAGGTSSQSVTIKRDATAPDITFVSPSPAAWYNANVTANWNCSDATSGAVSASVSASTSGEGSSLPATGTCTDNAGNTASDTQYFKVDATAPTISGSASPAANGNGWNNTDVDVTFTCDDTLSGVASCGPDQTLSNEGAGQSVTGNVTDNAGNTNSTTVSGINIDKTKPTANATAAPAANVNGWNNTDVTVSFSGSDGLSGIDFCDSDVVLNTEGAGQVASGTCTDKAGNVSDPATATVNIDLTKPLVALVGGPADGGTYYFGFVPAAPTCDASDALSGLDGSCAVGGYSNAIGTHTVTAGATDKAGNSESASATYTVLAWTLNGFFQPVDMGASVWNTVKGGSTVPLKFEIFAGPTELTNTAYVQGFTATQVQCSGGTEDAVEVVATGGTSLRYDSVAGQFIFNWQTPKKPGFCYKVTMTTIDGSKLEANFKLK
jgi:hypothetical protein